MRPQVETLQQLGGIDLVPTGINGADEVHVPAQGLALVQAHVFGRVTDLPLGGDLCVWQAVAANFHFATVGLDQAHQDAQQRGFSRAVDADQAHDLARGQLEVDVSQREVGVFLLHAAQRKGSSHVDYLLFPVFVRGVASAGSDGSAARTC